MKALTFFESPFTDAEVRAFIDSAPRDMSYSELASQVRDRFGPDRAWPIERIRAFCLTVGSPTRRPPFAFVRDPEVCTFIDDRIGRMTCGELAAACRRRFGSERAPGRTTLYRYLAALRSRLNQP